MGRESPRVGVAKGGSSAEPSPQWGQRRGQQGVTARRGAGGGVGGGMSEPPLQRGATATCSAAREMLNLTQPCGAPGRGEDRGGTPPQSHAPLCPPVSPRGSSNDGATTPHASSAPRPWRTPAVGLSKLLNPRCSSTQHPPPAPGLLGAWPPRGMPVVRLSAARQLRRSAPMQILQICASSAASARVAWPAARRRLERAPSRTAGCRQHPTPGLGGAALYLPRMGERCNVQWPRCVRLHQHPGNASWCWAGPAQRGAHAALCPTAQVSPEGRILLPQGSPQHRCFPSWTGSVH